MGAVTVIGLRPPSPQRPHVFVEGNDYNLWCFLFDGSTWAWTNMGKPLRASTQSALGAVTAMDTPPRPSAAHVFIAGDDGNLWCRWSTGSAWQWKNMGKPPGADIRATDGGGHGDGHTHLPQRPHVFMEGNDYNLWCHWSGEQTLRSATGRNNCDV